MQTLEKMWIYYVSCATILICMKYDIHLCESSSCTLARSWKGWEEKKHILVDKTLYFGWKYEDAMNKKKCDGEGG